MLRLRPGRVVLALVGWSLLASAPASAAGGSDLISGWQIRSSARVGAPGRVISDPTYSTTGWLPISQPETLMAGLLENGRYPGIFYSRRLASVPRGQFAVPWWYRDAFELHPVAGQRTFLRMRGVLSRADLWVNGRKVADRGRLQGAYSEIELDVTGAGARRPERAGAEGVSERRRRRRRAHAEHDRLEPRGARRQHGPAARAAARAGRRGLAARRARAAAERRRPLAFPLAGRGHAPQHEQCPGDGRAHRHDHPRGHRRRTAPQRPGAGANHRAGRARPRAFSGIRRCGGRTRWGRSRSTSSRSRRRSTAR